MDSHIPTYHSQMSIPKVLTTHVGIMNKGSTMTRDSTKINNKKGFMMTEKIKENIINIYYSNVK